jgi:hypothetical protein
MEQLDLEEASFNGNTEAIAISVQDLDQFKNLVAVVPKSSYEATQSLEMQKWMQYMQTRMAIMPESNKQELMAELDKIMGVDSDRFNPPTQPLAAQGLAPLQQAMAGNSEQPPQEASQIPGMEGLSPNTSF